MVSFGSTNRRVAINQVVTEPHLLAHSNDFEKAVENKLFVEHCDTKVASVTTEKEQRIWNFLKVRELSQSV